MLVSSLYRQSVSRFYFTFQYYSLKASSLLRCAIIILYQLPFELPSVLSLASGILDTAYLASKLSDVFFIKIQTGFVKAAEAESNDITVP